MRCRTFIAAVAAALAWTSAADAGETLADAFRDSVASSPELAAQRARVKAQRQSVPIALSEALPQIELTATASRIFRDDPSLRQRGSEKLEDWRGFANGSQLIFGSGRVWSRFRQARAQVESAESLYGEATQSLLLETVRAYAEVRRATASVEANTRTLENLEGQRRYVVANQRGGFLTSTDVAQAEARIASSRSGLARAVADLSIAAHAFERLVGHPPGTLEALAPVANLPETPDDALTRSQQRLLLDAARHSVRSAEASIAAAAAAGRPRLTFEATSAIENGFGAPGFERAIDDQIGFRLSVPFSSGGANWARTRQQRALREAARQELVITQQDLEQSVGDAWSELIAARVARSASDEEIRAAELALKGVRREQENGLRSIIDVLDQEQTLLVANLGRARAERDVAVAEYRLLFEVGELRCASCD